MRPKSVNGILLVDNLYTDNRKRVNRWRYRWPDGRYQTFEAATVQEANAFAAEANQARAQRDTGGLPEEALPYWAARYIDYREGLDPRLATKSAWTRRNRAAIRQFADEFKGVPVFQLSLKHLRPWWDSLTGNAQRNKKPELNRFCNHLIAEEITVNLQAHPFNVLMMRPSPAKARVRMALADYWAIYDTAGKVGLEYVQDAMALALLTFMRRGDLCSLRWDEHTDGKSLWKVISKATAQGKPKRLRWDFDRWPELRRIVARCRERSMQHQRCPFLLSRQPARAILGEVKEHAHQVLPDRLTEDFATARAASGVYAKLPADQKMPGIHEIRALGAHLHSDDDDQTAVMNAMAHSDIEMTRRYQAGHALEDIEIGIGELPANKLGGRF